jgi:aryl-alcohol dehydrogenase-like predicted oxidoreductase
MNIGFIGLGNMGQAMARNIARAGHQLTVYNRTRSRADELRAEGARVAGSPYDAAVNADVLITMLANDEAVEAVTFGTHRAARQEGLGALRCGGIMHTRKLGNSDLYITPVGFGAWAIGGSGWEYAWGPQDDTASIAAIHRALDLGVNWIDTAAVYGMGHSEEVVARALATWSGPRPYVFTKCGLRWDERGQVYNVLKADSIRRECEDSLRRLRVEVIDLYQIHWPTGSATETDEGWAAMAQLQREGKVRWIGVSNFDVERSQRAQAIAPITSLQPPYSLIRREIQAEILPFCQREGIGVIVYSPMASGLLTGAMTRERAANLAKDDWRRRDPEFNEPKLSQNLALVDRLRAVGARHGRSPGEVAIAWTLRHPAVTGAIVGARSATQVEGVMGAGDFRLSEEEIAAIERGLD